ncbi:hypothetical protein J4434_00480 [Candidatus Woesearchaeota archaeon]|nr:hypothetical protein [Candidatus Woesearchaeota archaeon]
MVMSGMMGNMMNNMMTNYGATGVIGVGLIWLIYFAVVVFIFSAIFWLTHNWLVCKCDKKKK